VQIVGCTPHPDDAFLREVGRTMTATDEGALASWQVLICDRTRSGARLSAICWKISKFA